MLRSLGAAVKGQTNNYEDNHRVLQSSSMIDSECKKRHLAIEYQKMSKCVAAEIAIL